MYWEHCFIVRRKDSFCEHRGHFCEHSGHFCEHSGHFCEQWQHCLSLLISDMTNTQLCPITALVLCLFCGLTMGAGLYGHETPEDNMVRNYGFEDQLDSNDWTISHGSVDRTTESARDGAYGVHVHSRSEIRRKMLPLDGFKVTGLTYEFIFGNTGFFKTYFRWPRRKLLINGSWMQKKKRLA